jgi:methionine sulfoxide reductase heme-binding subunit
MTSRHHQERLRARLLVHHLPLLILSAFSVALLYYTRAYKDVLGRLSFAVAYPALALIAATLVLGPLNILRKRRNPVSNDLRRDIGIWAGVLSLLHSAVGQCVHLRGRPWLYYFYRGSERHTIPFRHDLFGFANYTGLISALIVIALLATTNDYSLRALGTPRWKQLQRWNYGAAVLAAVHAFAYQTSEKQALSFVTFVGACVVGTIILQGAGFLRRRAAMV